MSQTADIHHVGCRDCDEILWNHLPGLRSPCLMQKVHLHDTLRGGWESFSTLYQKQVRNELQMKKSRAQIANYARHMSLPCRQTLGSVTSRH